MKEKNLPNFIRKKREEFLSKRAQSNDVSLIEKPSHTTGLGAHTL